MAWVDSTYLGRMIGTTQVTALGLGDASTFAQFEADARATVVSVLQFAGYSSPGTTVDTSTDAGAFLANLCAAVMARAAYGQRKGITLPARVQDGLEKLDAVYSRKLPVPGMSPADRDGYGGIVASPSTGDNSRPAVFARSRMTGF